MSRTLLIVESPNKARKIQGFLGRDVLVRASVGHVCDLPEKDYGVDLTTLEERYEVRNPKVVAELRALVRSGDFATVLLGTDPDREGEAIAWHLARELRLPARGAQRVEFREVTADAVRAALARPRAVDAARVDAQRSRRVLDRVVGFDVSSEICWPAGASSAGRVQTPALHILCEREREILAFRAETYWTLGVRYAEGFEAIVPELGAEAAPGSGADDDAEREGEPGEGERERAAGSGQGAARGAPPEHHDGAARGDPRNQNDAPASSTSRATQIRARRFPSREEAERTRGVAQRHDHVVRSVDKRRTTRRPDPPYTTSTLQQDASRKLRLSAKQAADQAQALFEAGYITYHRTDSVRVSDEAAAAARAYIGARHPDALPARPPVARGRAGAQDAHEAIRPTQLEGDDAPPPGTERLYALIKARFLASQCAPAVFDRTTVWVDSGPVAWVAEGAVLVEPGFLRFWAPYARTEDVELPAVTPGQLLTPDGYEIKEKQTTPPPRYDTGALIRKLELSGIGRPATFASIVETLLRRGYVAEVSSADAREPEREGGATPRGRGRGARGTKRVLQPTALGLQVDGLLTASFPTLVSEEYTAGMEAELDRIERREGETRLGYLKRWYADFRRAMTEALARAAAYRAEHGLEGRRGVAAGGGGARGAGARGEETAIRCDRCGEATYRKLARRGGRGSFLACPSCRLTRDVRARTRPNGCPKCGSTLVERRGKRKGVKFWGCVRYGAAERPCDHAEFEPRGEGRGAGAGAGGTGGGRVGAASSARAGVRSGARSGARARGAPPEHHDPAAETDDRNPSAAGRTRRSRATRAGSPSAGSRTTGATAEGARVARTRAAAKTSARAAAARPAPAPDAVREPTGKPCPRCERFVLDVVRAADGAATYACTGPGCGFTLPVGARRRGAPCPRCGGIVLERRAADGALAWACARAGCDYRTA